MLLDRSRSMGLEHVERLKIVLLWNFIGLIYLVISTHSREGKTLSYSRINIIAGNPPPQTHTHKKRKLASFGNQTDKN